MTPEELVEMHRRVVQRAGMYNHITAALLGLAEALCMEIAQLKKKLERYENNE